MYADSPAPALAALVFRVGRADESFAAGGLTHLVEHLTLFPLARQRYQYNGRVEEAVCLFYAAGTPAEVFGFLSEVASALDSLPLERLAAEKRILGTEWGGHDPGVDGRLLDHRYGASGYGLSNYYEWGLDWVESEEVAGWAQEMFTSGNAAVWCTVEPPEDLVLDLPRGERRAAPVPNSLDGLQTPLYLEEGTGGVALGTVIERSSAAHAAFAIASQRIYDELRREEGVSYSSGSSYHPLDGRLAHVVVSADCQPRDARLARDGLLRVLDDLAANGPTEEELSLDREELERFVDDPAAVPNALDSAARDLLFGVDHPTNQQLLAERDALTSATVSEALAEAMDEIILVTPPGNPRSEAMRRYAERKFEPDKPVDGKRYKPGDRWAEWGERSEVIVGDRGVTFVPGQGEPTTVLYSDCVGSIPGLSGTLTLVARNGAAVSFRPGTYGDGVKGAAAIREALSDELLIPLSPREAELKEAVSRELDQQERDLVPGELDLLATLLAGDEQPEHLGVGARGKQLGLLVVSKQRFMFIFRGTNADDLFETALEDISEVRVQGLVSKRLTVQATGRPEEVFKNISPNGRMQEIAATLEGRGQ